MSWLLVLHRIANAENSRHHVTCGSCGRQNFRGLRYKSERANYHLCQSCFWRGKIGPKHKEDVFKEYNAYKGGSSTPTGSANGSSSSKKASLNSCLPEKGSSSRKGSAPRFPERERTMDLSNMVPASPQPSLHQINGYMDRSSSRYSSTRSDMMPAYGQQQQLQDPYQQQQQLQDTYQQQQQQQQLQDPYQQQQEMYQHQQVKILCFNYVTNLN